MPQVSNTDDIAAALSVVEEGGLVPADEIPGAPDPVVRKLAYLDEMDTETLQRLREARIGSNLHAMYIAWRRRSAISLSSQGFKIKEIAALLDVAPGTISQDLRRVREEYEGLTTREWAVIVEERIMELDQDIFTLRRQLDTMPHRYIERPADDGEVELLDIGPDIDQQLRIRDRIMALNDRRDKLLGVDKAAAARHVETKKLEVVLSFDQTSQVREIEPTMIEAEIVDG